MSLNCHRVRLLGSTSGTVLGMVNFYSFMLTYMIILLCSKNCTVRATLVEGVSVKICARTGSSGGGVDRMVHCAA